MNILFTSVGRRVELLEAFRRAFASANVAGRITAIDVDPLAPALQSADVARIVPPVQSPEFVVALVRLCAAEHVDFVFPLIDPDITVLARNRAVVEETGARVVVVSEHAAGIAADKVLTTRFFADLGLQTPRFWTSVPDDLTEKDFPLFIKPRQGSASRNAFRIENAEQLKFFAAYVDNPIIEDFLPGPEITTDVMSSLDGEVLSVVSRMRLEVRNGEVLKGRTIRDVRILEACLRIAHELPARGPITVQCILKEGLPYFTEINARFGGGAPLGFAAGVNSPLWFLANACGFGVPIPPVGEYREGLFMSRCDRSFFLEQTGIDKIRGGAVRS